MGYGRGFLTNGLYGAIRGLYRAIKNALKDLIENCGLISYADTVVDGFMEDQVGFETRPSIKSNYISTLVLLTAGIGLPNEPLTYLNADTLLDVPDTTDGSGNFTFPIGVKVADIKITSTGDYFKLEEGAGDTISDHVNGRIAKLSSTPTFVPVNNIDSRANQIGYSVSDGSHWAWDETLLDVIFNLVVIPNMTTDLSVAYYSETPLFTFILDVVTALNGYSLRKLKSTATKAIRVRRSSDNAELDIGFVGEDLDENALTTFVGANDGFVVTWYNQVNNGVSGNAIQVSAAIQPEVVQSGVIVKRNGKPSIDHTLNTSSYLDAVAVVPQPFLVNAVIEALSVDVDGRHFASLSTVQDDVYCGMATGSLFSMGAGTVLNSGSLYPAGVLRNYSAVFNGANSTIDVNGTDIVNGDAGLNDVERIRLGIDGLDWNGLNSEFILSGDVSNYEIIRDNQISYYSIV